MAVGKTKDGRWFVCGRKGFWPDEPNRTKEYFGRDGEALAQQRDLELKASKPVKSFAPTLEVVAAAYFQAKISSMEKTSLDILRIKLTRVVLPYFKNTPASNLTPARLDKYVARRLKTVKRTTVHRDLSDIRAILNWAVGRGMISDNPMKGYEMPKRDDARIIPPTLSEIRKIIKHAATHLVRAIYISYYTGLRPGQSEMLRLTWEDVNFESENIRVWSAKKGGLPHRDIPLHPDLLEKMQEWQDGHKLIIHRRGVAIRSIKTAWRRAKERAGITRRLRLYDIRHEFIDSLLKGGADFKSVSEMAGHTTPDTTRKIYQHINPEQRKRTIKKRKKL